MKSAIKPAELLDTKQAAEYLGYSVSSLEWWRTQKIGPRYYKMARLVRYRVSDLDAFISAGLVKTHEKRGQV